MPSIDDIVQVKGKKPFKKKAYRPWNLLDETPVNLPETRLDFKHSTDLFSEKLIPTPHKKMDNNKITNSKQIDDSLVNKKKNNRVTNRNLLVNNKQAPLNDKKTIGKQIDNVLDNALVNESDKKQGMENNLTEAVKRLTGHQRKLLLFIVEDCISHGLLTTNYITNESLRILINTNTNSVKTSIQRLIEKKLITREKGKRGNGGFTCYKITKSIRDAVLEEKQKILISKQFGNALDNALVNNSVTDKETMMSSSSSFKDLNKTTTEAVASATNHGWLNEIDIEPLSMFNFSSHYLKQLTPEMGLTPEEIQGSINAFAFDLIENRKTETISSPISYLMKILKQGIPYIPPPNYESQKDKAMRLSLERKKETLKKRREMEEEALELACEEWLESLSKEEKINIVSLQSESDQWKQCIKFLEKEHDTVTFDTWVKPLEAENDNGLWSLYAPNEHVKQKVTEKFTSAFQKFLGNFMLKVGHKDYSAEQNNVNQHSQEISVLMKYFKENLWPQKRSEFLGSV